MRVVMIFVRLVFCAAYHVRLLCDTCVQIVRVERYCPTYVQSVEFCAHVVTRHRIFILPTLAYIFTTHHRIECATSVYFCTPQRSATGGVQK